MKNKIYATLSIYSTKITSEQITKKLGLAPDRSWVKGEGRILLNHKTGERRTLPGLHKNHLWELRSKSSATTSLDAPVRQLLNRLKPYSKKIKSLSALPNVDVQLSGVIYWYQDSAPPLNFKKEVMGAINDLGAGLDLDLYMLGDEK